MKKFYLIISIVITLTILVGCGPKENEPKIYKITKSTYLYDDAHADAGSIDTLLVGVAVKPAYGNTELYCQKTKPPDNIVLCHVEVIGTKQVGWVIEKWLEE